MEYNYTKIDNKVMNKLITTKFNGTQYRILIKVLRSTAGFDKDSHELSVSYITSAIGANKQLIKRELKNLINKKVLRVEKIHTKTSSRSLSLNRNFNEWIIEKYKELDHYNEIKSNKNPGNQLDTTGGSEGVTSSGNQLGTKSGDELGTQKEYNKNKINNIYIEDINEIYQYWVKKFNEFDRYKLDNPLKKIIIKKLNHWNKNLILKAIENYYEVYESDHYYDYKWTLKKFLLQSNGAPRFMKGLDKKSNGDLYEEYSEKKYRKKEYTNERNRKNNRKNKKESITEFSKKLFEESL